MPLNTETRQTLQQIVNECLVVSRKWLLTNGIKEHALDNLVKADQLDVIMRGVYKRPFIKITWQDIVYSLQKIFNSNVVVGGVSALQMEGFAHYLPFNHQKQIHLYSGEPLPAWINVLSDDFSFITHLQTDLLGRSHHQEDLYKVLKSNTLSKFWKDDTYSIEISNPERAILELLADVPEKTSFEYAEKILQGMTSLSPSKLQDLLMVCDNIRIRRLFLWMAERQNHQWFKTLNLESISLGSGNRVLVKGGVLNKKYKITVPQEYQ